MIVKIENLHKSFKDVKAVDGISFCVKEGELFAFLGVNGAGKSTTINIISGILQKDGGKALICGEDLDKNIDKIKSNIGIVFQNSVLDKKLSGYDNLKYRAALYGIFGADFKAKLKEMTELLDLKDILKRPINQLSGGQKQRVAIARALCMNPSLLCFDEPTSALDPELTAEVLKVIRQLKCDGVTMLIVTHEINFAREVADTVIFLDNGDILEKGNAKELIDNPKNARTREFLKRISE